MVATWADALWQRVSGETAARESQERLRASTDRLKRSTQLLATAAAQHTNSSELNDIARACGTKEDEHDEEG